MAAAGKLVPQPWMDAPETRAVLAALSAGGARVRFVGGCVRDAVLGRPAGDIDIATPDPPETVMRLLHAANVRAVPTGFSHGTVTAIAGAARFEITTLRRDVETDGRHAKVAFTGDWAADAARRDFTINTLSCEADGTLHDPVGGLDDVRAGRVRFVGDAAQRIAEDVLRLPRFFRFYALYGNPPPDAGALAACREMAPALDGLSGERLWGELSRLLGAPEPAEALGLMDETGALGRILPGAEGVGALAELCALEGARPDPLRRLALLVRARGGGAGAAAGRLRLSSAERGRLAAMAEPAAEVTAGLDARARRRALYRVGADAFADLVHLAWAEALAAAPGDAGGLARAFGAMLQTARRWDDPKLPVGGEDVVALGIEEGPEVGRLLAKLEAWWETGDFSAGRGEALAKLGELVDAAGAAARPLDD